MSDAHIDFDFEDEFFREKELIKLLSFSKEDNKICYNLFSNLIRSPIDDEDFYKYVGFYMKFETLRQDLGLKSGDKPGDFDIILIPYSLDKIYFDRTCAIEVKIVRPRRNNSTKAPDSYGTKQIRGLIKDGFPLVGLLHICTPEPLLDEERAAIKIGFPISESGETEVDSKYDQFAANSSLVQMKKLVSKEIPKYVGLNTVGVNKIKGGGLVTWFNHDFNMNFGSGYFNPNMKDSTIEMVKAYFDKNTAYFVNTLL